MNAEQLSAPSPAAGSDATLRAAGTILGVSALALVVLIAALSLTGFRATAINGRSMGSAAPLGSMAFFRSVPAEALRSGDIVAVKRGSNAPVVHRIVSLQFSGGLLQATLRGDANADADPQPVILEGRTHRMGFSIPLLGYALGFVTSTLGVAVLLGAPALAALLSHGQRPAQANRHDLPRLRIARLWCTLKLIQARRIVCGMG